MPRLNRVRLKPGLHHRCGESRIKGPAIILVTDAELAAFGDKFQPAPDEPVAPAKVAVTDEAVVLAIASGVELETIEEGRGAGGQVVQEDVREITAEKSARRRVNASNGAIAVANEMEIDISQVVGTGTKGRVLVKDVRAYGDT